MRLADKIRTLRVTHRYTLADVAKGTNLSVSYLSDMERGRTEPSLRTLETIARFYNATLEIEFVDTLKRIE